MKHNFQFGINGVSVNVDKMEMYVIQSKNGTILNLDVYAKKKPVSWKKALAKNVTYGILVRVIVSVIKCVKLVNI